MPNITHAHICLHTHTTHTRPNKKHVRLTLIDWQGDETLFNVNLETRFITHTAFYVNVMLCLFVVDWLFWLLLLLTLLFICLFGWH